MITLHIFALAAIFIFIMIFFLLKQAKQVGNGKMSGCLLLVFGGGLVLRLVLAYFNTGFANDTACFSAWADRMFEVGAGGFYTSEVFTDYPPGYMYILYLVGALRSFLQIPHYSGMHLLLLKLPAILCDMICAGLLYREAAQRHSSFTGVLLSTAYLFNPAVILNSSVWGQVDSVYTLAIVCMCLCLVRGKLFPAYVSFGLGILIKPQTLVFSPVLLAAILDYVFLQDFSLKRLLKNFAQGLGVIAIILLLALPFGLSNVVTQYTSTLASYPYAAVNAYNFWGFLGQNWISQDTTFLFLSFKSWGTVAILLIVLFTFIISLRTGKDSSKYPLLGAFVILTMFVFSVRMHERYMFTGLILLLLSFLYKPVKHNFICYAVFSVLHFYNTAHVLYFYDPANYNRTTPVILAVSSGMVLCIIYLYQGIVNYYKKDIPAPKLGSSSGSADVYTAEGTVSGTGSQAHFFTLPLPPLPSAKKVRFTKADLLLLLAITAIYSCFALYDLGDMQAPATTYALEQGDSITLDFGEGNSPSTISYYIAPTHDRSFTLEGKNHPDHEWVYLGDITFNTVFTWKDEDLGYENIRFVRLTLKDENASILELAFTDKDGNLLLPVNQQDYAALFDENQLYPESSTFRNSMYFDEIYHGRTAYEFVNGLTTYENTHPPLGKIFIALGVLTFGMNPFGWRIAGTVFGIAMLPFLYLFGKKITKNTPAAALSCSLFAFDFMHFTQTRIATIDVYITFFVILMYYFMYQYCNMSFYDRPLKKTLLPLGACGISMGLGIACKWTGAYAGAGLAILFFAVLFRRYREYLYAGEHPEEVTGRISHAAILRKFVPHTVKTLGFCVIFFVVIPFAIYLLSYLPFADYSDAGLLKRMLDNQVSMFSYHSDLDATHPYSSSWQEWPVMVRPIWYYSNIVKDTAEVHIREGISAFGNPLVWWVGIPAFIYMIYLAIKKKDRTAAFLATGYLAQYLPWFFVTRITFIYHYFPSVAFVVLMIVHSLIQWKKRFTKRSFIVVTGIYALAAFELFLLFYPVLSGQPVDAGFVDKYLRWFDSWVLVAR